MPEFFVLSFLEFFEVPFGVYFLRSMYDCSFFANKCELDSVNWLTSSNVKDRETLLYDLLALFISFVWVPVVSQKSKAKMLRKSKGNVIIFNIISIEVYWCEERLSIFKSGNDEAVIVWILFVPFFIADSSQVICIILYCKMNIVIEWFWFSRELIHLSGNLLEIRILSSCG